MIDEEEQSHSGNPDGEDDSALVAVVGMAGRFPGAVDLGRFWQNLRDGVESVKWLTDEELLAAGESPALLGDPAYVRACPVLEDIDKFDAGFFGFSPREASITDPQHRIFFETAWEALENAGHVPERTRGMIGVFASCGLNAYLMHHLVTNSKMMEDVGEWLLRHTGNDMNFLATRVSYELDLRGPSLNVQTACSSSLVAVHLAVQSLLNGECDMALAGGSTISLPQHGYIYKEGEILSSDGHCRPFDARSKGTLFGSGAGCVILKRFADARADRNRILAVVRGSAINNDGSQKVGYLAPSVEGQARVVAEALTIAGVEPDTISYVETHGTGTLIGDPIEVSALTQAYRTRTQKKGFCAIGSLKSNIGHLGEAAGVASFIKTVLALEHRELPPSLNYEVANPSIDFAKSPFFVNSKRTPWTTSGSPRRAGVTALGAGGTNSHVILEEGPAAPSPGPSRRWQLLQLSARTPTALDMASRRLATHLRERPESNLADVAYTLQVGRRAFAHRRTAVCRDVADAISLLEGGDPKRVHTQQVPVDARREVVFMFPGGGAQYAGMGQDLHETEPVYRAAIDECLAFARSEVKGDLHRLMFPANASEVEAASVQMESPSLALPVLFATEYAMAKLLLSWGIQPVAMIGHSMGEYVAACLANVISVRDGVRLVATRGKLFETLPEGGMLVVPLPAEEVRQALPEFDRTLSFAAINAPALCVASGPKDALTRLEQALVGREIEVQRVHINVAAHSAMLEPILRPFEDFCRTIAFRAPQMPYVSNLTGTWIRPNEATDPRYWVQHLRHTVRFAEGIGEILSTPERICLEVGPGRTLASLARQQDRKPAGALPSIAHPRDAASASAFLLNTLGQLWAAGVEPDWSRLYPDENRQRVSLPTYPFERKSYWVERPRGGALATAARPRDRALRKKPDIADWFWIPSWRPSPPPAAEAATPDSKEDKVSVTRRLIFADQSGLAARLSAHWPDAVVVSAGPDFARRGAGKYTLDPGRRGHFERLVADLSRDGKLPDQIVHLGAVSPPPGEGSAAGDAKSLDARHDEAVRAHFFSHLFLAQALAAEDHRTELAIISSCAEAVHGHGAIDPLKALRKGPARVITAEVPDILCRQIDVVWPASSSWAADQVVSQIVAELSVPRPDSVIAFRGRERLAQTYEPVRFSPARSSLPALRDRGVYLITGGLGGVGLTLAEHLARTVKARLVLIGRSALPPREEWGRLAADPIQGPRIRAVEAMEADGAEVMVRSADVASHDDMRAAIHAAQKRFGRLNGVIHAAGVLNDELLQLKTREAAERVLRPKVKGALVLDALLRGASAPTDFLALFSSVSAVLGLQGQIDYTSANAFLDALAADRATREASLTVSINWSAWREVGMAAQIAARNRESSRQKARDPWLGSVISDVDTRVVYGADLSREDLWLLGEHVVRGGESLIPGTGFLELARAALEESSPRASQHAVELRDVLFLSPFVVRQGEKRALRVAVDRNSGDFSIETAGAAPAETHVTGNARQVVVAPTPSHSIEELRRRCPLRQELRDGFLPQSFMDFGPRWGNVKGISLGTAEALIELELPSAFAADLEQRKLHPALLDMATGGAQALVPGFNPGADFFVPFSYGRVLLRKDLPGRFWSHVRHKPGKARDVAMFEATLLSETGEVLVEIESFVMKLVPAGAALTAGAARAPATVATTPTPAAPFAASAASDLRDAAFREGMLPAEGIEAFERVLGARVGPQVVASSIDLLDWLAITAPQTEPRESARPAEPNAAGKDGPKDEIERAIARIWEDLLGVSAVGVHDDFFELGGHSLTAVRLVAKLEKAFKVKLPLGTLFEARTVSQLAGLLRGSSKAPTRIALVPIQPRGSRPPFFCVHGVGGEVLTYAELAKLLAPEQPFLGLRAQGHDGSQEPLRTIAEQATLYVKEMREYQPEGPYYIGGYSHGGRVVFEMAQQLVAAGQKVNFVGVIDTWPTQDWPYGALYWVRWLRNLPSWLAQDFKRTSFKANVERAQRVFKRLLKGVMGRRGAGPEVEAPPDLAEQMNVTALPESIRKTFQANFEAFVNYKPRPYPGRVTLFRAQAQPIFSPHSPDLGWGKFAGGGVNVVSIPGNHSSILLLAPDLQTFAQKLLDELKKAQSPAADTTQAPPKRGGLASASREKQPAAADLQFGAKA